MATTGTVNVKVTGYDTLRFTWNTSSQSIENNTSTVSWKMELVAGSSGKITSNVSKKWSVTVDGKRYSGTNTIGIANNATKTLASGSTVIEHDDDGKKTFNFSFYQQFSGLVFSGDNISDKSGNGTGVLDTIPRASSFTVSEGTLGVAQTITVTRQSTVFRHGITYSCGSVSTQLICAWNTASESVSFTPPLDLAWQAPNGTRVWVDVHLQTYHTDGTPIGKTVTKGVWMAIPASVKPSCTVSVSDPTGYATKYGGYIQGQSKLAIKVTPTTAYGSTISGYLINADGNKYTSQEVTTDVVRSTGNVEVYADVADSRGRLGYARTTINVIPYAVPTITHLKVHRCDANGADNERGLYVRVNYGYVIDSISGKNGMSGYIQYKKTTETQFTSVALTTAFSVENGTFIFAADDAASYDVQFRIADSFMSTGSSTVVSTGFTIIHFSPSGKGMNIGGINNGEGLRLYNIPFYIEDVEVDYIVEQGESGGWFYRKWNGGIAECWKVHYASVNSGKTNYSGFYYSDTIAVPFPFTFANLPTVTVDGGSASYMNFVRVFGKYSDKASFTVVGLTDAGTVDVTVDIKAIGMWK